MSLRNRAPAVRSRRDGGLEILHLDREAVPAAGLLRPAIRHRLPTATRRVRLAQHQAQVAVLQHRERRRRMHDLAKPELTAVERDRRVDIVDDVSDLDRGHILA